MSRPGAPILKLAAEAVRGLLKGKDDETVSGPAGALRLQGLVYAAALLGRARGMDLDRVAALLAQEWAATAPGTDRR